MAFKLSNGETFTYKKNRHATNLLPKHQGPYLRVLIKQEYEDGTVKDAAIKPGELESDKRVTIPHTVINRKTDKTQEVQATYLLAENEDYREYPSVNKYLNDGYSYNVSYKHVMELTFKTERYTQRLFKTWLGKYSFCSMLASLEDEISEDIKSGEFSKQGFTYDHESDLYLVVMYNDTGDLLEIEMNEHDFFDHLMSARIIEFKETHSE